MPNHFKHDKDVMPADRDHAWRSDRGFELEPIGGEPEIADRLPEDLYSRAAAAERHARTTFGMVDQPRRIGKHPLLAAPYGSRIASDNRCYLVGSAALALGLVAMLGALYFHRSAAPHVAVDQWCADFRHALSCPNAQSDARKE